MKARFFDIPCVVYLHQVYEVNTVQFYKIRTYRVAGPGSSVVVMNKHKP